MQNLASAPYFILSLGILTGSGNVRIPTEKSAIVHVWLKSCGQCTASNTSCTWVTVFNTAHLVYREALNTPGGSPPVLLTLPLSHSLFLCSSLRSPFHPVFLHHPYLLLHLLCSYPPDVVTKGCTCHSIWIMRCGTWQGVASAQDLIPILLSTAPTPGHSGRNEMGDGLYWTGDKNLYPWCIGDWMRWSGFVLPRSDKHPALLEECLGFIFFFLVTHIPLVTFHLMSHIVGIH